MPLLSFEEKSRPRLTTDPYTLTSYKERLNALGLHVNHPEPAVVYIYSIVRPNCLGLGTCRGEFESLLSASRQG
jgi:hypothetical protein